MSLIAFNLTVAPLTLAAGIQTLAPSTAPGVRGPRTNVTSELRGLTGPDYTALQVQVTAAQVEYIWTDEEEYDTGTLEVTAGGGGGGGGGVAIVTNSDPGSVPALAGVDGAVPVDNGANGIAFRRLSSDDLDTPFSITSFNPGFTTTKEIGDAIVNPNFTASYNATLTTPLTINDGVNTDTITLAAQNAFGYNNGGTSGLPARSYTKTGLNQTVTWTLSAKKLGGPTKNAATAAVWRGRRFYDIRVPAAYNETFIESMGQTNLGSGFGGTYVFGAGLVTTKVYLCWPTGFGTPASIKDQNGFVFPMTKVATAVVVTNSFGVLVPGGYDVWESGNFIVSAFTLTVT